MTAKQIFMGILLVFILILLIVGLMLLWEIFVPDQTSQEDPVAPTNQEKEILIEANQPIRQEIYYRRCRHLESEEKLPDVELVGMNLQELNALGWDAFRAEEGIIVLFREEDSLCSEDSAKRHIALYNGKLAVFKGPIGSVGEPTEVLGIGPEVLEEDWQRKLNEKGGIEFPDEESLFSALESLDEY